MPIGTKRHLFICKYKQLIPAVSLILLGLFALPSLSEWLIANNTYYPGFGFLVLTIACVAGGWVLGFLAIRSSGKISRTIISAIATYILLGLVVEIVVPEILSDVGGNLFVAIAEDPFELLVISLWPFDLLHLLLH